MGPGEGAEQGVKLEGREGEWLNIEDRKGVALHKMVRWMMMVQVIWILSGSAVEGEGRRVGGAGVKAKGIASAR